MSADDMEDLLAGTRAVMIHLLTHMELLVPGFTLVGFRRTLFQVEAQELATMPSAEVANWERIIDQFLPHSSRCE